MLNTGLHDLSKTARLGWGGRGVCIGQRRHFGRCQRAKNAIALKRDLNPSSFTTQMRDLLPFLPAILIALAA
jgi:hypothetical protein